MHVASAVGNYDILQLLGEIIGDDFENDRWNDKLMELQHTPKISSNVWSMLSNRVETLITGLHIVEIHCLMEIVPTASVEKIREVFRLGANPRKTNYDGINALHYAAERGNREAVKYFLSLPGNTNEPESKGELPLHKIRH